MNRLVNSKIVAWLALMLIIIVIITTFGLREVWWAFIDEFFAFMMIFCWLASLYLMKMSPFAAKKLQSIALVSGVLMILALIGEFIAYQVVFG